MRLVDAHCHFDFPRFDGVREQELAAAAKGGVRALVVPGVRRADWDRVQALANPARGIWYCLGIHPWFVEEHTEADLELLGQRLGSHPDGCIGVGECGLDGLKGSFEEQLPWFRAQIQLATRHDYPLVIHSVKAHDQVHAALRAERWQGRALVHGFSGSYQQASKLVDLGCYIGVGGVITRDRARKTRDAIARLPAEALVLETDAPDMAPAGVEKGMNSPACLPAILDCLARLRGQDAEALAEVLLANVSRLYGRSESVLAPLG